MVTVFAVSLGKKTGGEFFLLQLPISIVRLQKTNTGRISVICFEKLVISKVKPDWAKRTLPDPGLAVHGSLKGKYM